MQRFDCLAKDCPLLGPHLLEASAGTGKTFSIEHVYVRLILEGIEVEQILAVTFTRAATRELKQRIRSNLEKALQQLETNTITWPYLESTQNLRALRDAISGFDRCQIFTIHGFCHRMLREFAFEAKIGLSLPEFQEKAEFPQALRQAVRDFLEWGVQSQLVCPEQVSLLFRSYSSLDEIGEQLLKEESGGPAKTFQQLFDECKAALHSPVEEEKLLADFRALQRDYKVQVKGDFESQVIALSRWTQDPENPIYFRTLLREGGSLFSFLDPKSRKVKVQEGLVLHYPGFFDRAKKAFVKPKARQVLQVLRSAWKPVEKKVFVEHLNPDEILRQMQRALREPLFLEKIQTKYQAAIIDEFQDTDPLQWEIFRTISPHLRAFYLVGDPKQSIYRFRRADIYTYLDARAHLGEHNVYSLDMNFRSSPELVHALNTLFQRNWLSLPKVNGFLPYLPVRAGVQADADEKGTLYFVKGEGEVDFESQLLPFAFREVDRLAIPYEAVAILVKDRYQAEKAVRFFSERGVPAVARNHALLGETVSFQAVKELFAALHSLRDASAAKAVSMGPFGELNLAELKEALVGQGIGACFQKIPTPHTPDLMQVLDALFTWEQQEGFSFEGLGRALKEIAELDPAAQESGAAVQVMTLHVSKGLEFDTVFAWGLGTKTPESGDDIEEAEAEKLRQLYVAMTRAKKRLYAPLILNPFEAKPGTHSPIELFCRALSPEELLALPGEMLPPTLDAPPTTRKAVQETYEEEAPLPVPHFPSSSLLSFTAMAQEHSPHLRAMEASTLYTLHTLPRGAETGVWIHGLFEKLFSSPRPIWQDRGATRALIERELTGSPLMPWQEAIQEMVQQTLDVPLNGMTLRTLLPSEVFVEVEFLFESPPNFIKGFIDLVFYHQGRYSFIDWKTNWLGDKTEDYTPTALQQAMDAHDYGLQATLYREALRLHLGDVSSGFYLFVRGNAVKECNNGSP